MLVSGTVLALAPSGRIAGDVAWHLAGLTRGGWEAIHLTAALAFSAAALWHLALHLPIYRNLLGGTRAHPYGSRAEAVVILVIAVVLVATAILDLPPARWLVDLNLHFRQVYWLLG